MYFKGRRRFREDVNIPEKKYKRIGKKSYIKDCVLQFGGKRKIRGGAFPWDAVVPFALEAIKVIL